MVMVTKVTHLAVAISTLDRPDALARCLDALWSGDVLPAEIIVVDQSRNDASCSVVEERRSRNMPIVYIRQEPRGLAASQNTALTRANSPIVAVIDDDCVPERCWLAVIEKTFASLDTLSAVTGRVLPLNPEGDRLYPVSSRTSTVRAEFTRKCSPWVVGSGNNFAAKREWFMKVGGCDERLGPGAPGKGGVDMDLFYRLLRAGAHIRYEPEALVYHERQNKTGRITRRPMYGHGMGACCTIWLRQRDFYALSVLAHWLFFRARLLMGAIWRRQWMSVYEELLMLGGTIKGLAYGISVRESAGGTLSVVLKKKAY
jgi:GT2 family glycosyltransferase